jgi:seryl-tRNA synthetase
MHDIRAIRENPAAFDAALARRGVEGASSEILKVDEARRACILKAETAQAEQNKASKEVGAAKAKGDEAEFERLRALVAEKKAEVAAMQAEAKALDAQLTDRADGPAQPAAGGHARRRGRGRQCRVPPLGHAARVRLHPEGAFRDRRA